MTEDPGSAGRRAASDGRVSNVVPIRSGGLRVPLVAPLRLLSCSLSLEDDRGTNNAFFAEVTRDDAAFAQSVLDRFGAEAIGEMRFGSGRRWSSAISDMLVSGAVGHMLRAAAADPDLEDCQGFRVGLELGFLK